VKILSRIAAAFVLSSLVSAPVLLATPVLADITRESSVDEFTGRTTHSIQSDTIYPRKAASFPYNQQSFTLVAQCIEGGNKYERKPYFFFYNNDVDFNLGSNNPWGLHGLTALDIKVEGEEMLQLYMSAPNHDQRRAHLVPPKSSKNANDLFIKYLNGSDTALMRFSMFNGETVVMEMPTATLPKHYADIKADCKK